MLWLKHILKKSAQTQDTGLLRENLFIVLHCKSRLACALLLLTICQYLLRVSEVGCVFAMMVD